MIPELEITGLTYPEVITLIMPGDRITFQAWYSPTEAPAYRCNRNISITPGMILNWFDIIVTARVITDLGEHTKSFPFDGYPKILK
jgi:hypothetical protein